MNSTLPIDADTERALRAFLTRAARQYELAGAVLFGSRARRSHRPDSDADLAVLLRGPRGPRVETTMALADLAYEVLLDTGVLIQPLPVWEDDWAHPERSPHPALLQAIHREGVRL